MSVQKVQHSVFGGRNDRVFGHLFLPSRICRARRFRCAILTVPLSISTVPPLTTPAMSTSLLASLANNVPEFVIVPLANRAGTDNFGTSVRYGSGVRPPAGENHKRATAGNDCVGYYSAARHFERDSALDIESGQSLPRPDFHEAAIEKGAAGQNVGGHRAAAR